MQNDQKYEESKKYYRIIKQEKTEMEREHELNQSLKHEHIKQLNHKRIRTNQTNSLMIRPLPRIRINSLQTNHQPFPRLPLSAPNTPPSTYHKLNSSNTNSPIHFQRTRSSSEPPILPPTLSYSKFQTCAPNTLTPSKKNQYLAPVSELQEETRETPPTQRILPHQLTRSTDHHIPQKIYSSHSTPTRSCSQGPQLPLPPIPDAQNEHKVLIHSPSTSTSLSPKSVKSPSRLSRILQPVVRQKDSDERIQVDEPLVIPTIRNHDQNQSKDPSATENQVPKLTRLSKRLQAMKAASALMKFNSPSNANTSPIPSAPSCQKTATNKVIPSSSSSKSESFKVTPFQTKPRARREPSENNPSHSKPTNQTNLNNSSINKISKSEPSEMIKLSKLTTRHTNLNKKRLSVIKVEEVIMQSYRPPSPEGKFRKNNLNNVLWTSKKTARNQEFVDQIGQEQVEEIRVSLPINTLLTTTSVPCVTQDHLNSSPTDPTQSLATPEPAPDLSQITSDVYFNSTHQLHAEEKLEIKKKVRWNQESLVIDLEEQYHQQPRFFQRKQQRRPHKHELSPKRTKQDDKEEDIPVEPDETAIDPIFNLSPKNFTSPLTHQTTSNHSALLSINSSHSFSSDGLSPVKPILKINFRNAQDRKKRLESSKMHPNNDCKQEEGSAKEYQYDLDDFGNLLINADQNPSSHHVMTSIHDSHKSLNLEPIFIKVTRRIWLQ